MFTDHTDHTQNTDHEEIEMGDVTRDADNREEFDLEEEAQLAAAERELVKSLLTKGPDVCVMDCDRCADEIANRCPSRELHTTD